LALSIGKPKDSSSTTFIIDYNCHADTPSDRKLVELSIKRIIQEHKLPIKRMWTDRGMSSRVDETMLKSYGIQSGARARNLGELSHPPRAPSTQSYLSATRFRRSRQPTNASSSPPPTTAPGSGTGTNSLPIKPPPPVPICVAPLSL
jgi:hypothetical protein